MTRRSLSLAVMVVVAVVAALAVSGAARASALVEQCAAGDRAAVTSGQPQVMRAIEAENSALSEVIAAEARKVQTEKAAVG